jgi:hypothetical protein
MSTGPQHYQEAERLAERSRAYTDSGDRAMGTAIALEAIIHMLGALTAATALNDTTDGMPIDDYDEWRNTVGTPTAPAKDPF